MQPHQAGGHISIVLIQIKVPAMLTTDGSGWMLDAAPGQAGQHNAVHGGFVGLLAAKY